MMDISTAWTPAERLRVIQAKAEAIMDTMQARPFSVAFRRAKEIHRLASEAAEYLEADRRRLLEGVD